VISVDASQPTEKTLPPARRGRPPTRAGHEPSKTSRFAGVYWVPAKGGKWRAKISVRGNMVSLGDFDVEEDAARAYDAARATWRALMKSVKTPLNFPGEAPLKSALAALPPLPSELQPLAPLSPRARRPRTGDWLEVFWDGEDEWYLGRVDGQRTLSGRLELKIAYTDEQTIWEPLQDDAFVGDDAPPPQPDDAPLPWRFATGQEKDQQRLDARYVGRTFIDNDAAGEGARKIVRIEKAGSQWTAVAAQITDNETEQPYLLNEALDKMVDAYADAYNCRGKKGKTKGRKQRVPAPAQGKDGDAAAASAPAPAPAATSDGDDSDGSRTSGPRVVSDLSSTESRSQSPRTFHPQRADRREAMANTPPYECCNPLCGRAQCRVCPLLYTGFPFCNKLGCPDPNDSRKETHLGCASAPFVGFPPAVPPLYCKWDNNARRCEPCDAEYNGPPLQPILRSEWEEKFRGTYSVDLGDGQIVHLRYRPFGSTIVDLVVDLNTLRPRHAPQGSTWYCGAQQLRRDDTTLIADRYFNDNAKIVLLASPDEASFTDARGTEWRAGPHVGERTRTEGGVLGRVFGYRAGDGEDGPRWLIRGEDGADSVSADVKPALSRARPPRPSGPPRPVREATPAKGPPAAAPRPVRAAAPRRPRRGSARCDGGGSGPPPFSCSVRMHCVARSGAGGVYSCYAESDGKRKRLCAKLDGSRREPLDFVPNLCCSSCLTPKIQQPHRVSRAEWEGLFSVTLWYGAEDSDRSFVFPHRFWPRDTLSAAATTIRTVLDGHFDRSLSSNNFGTDLECLSALARAVKAQEHTIQVRRMKGKVAWNGKATETRTYSDDVIDLSGETTLADAGIFTGDLITIRFRKRAIVQAMCPICQHDLPETAVTLQCGHKMCVGCKEDLEKHSRGAVSCPTGCGATYVPTSSAKRRKTTGKK
jgi:hypothetical protein